MKVSSIAALSGLFLLTPAAALVPLKFINDCVNFATGFANENTEVLSSTYVLKGTVIPLPDSCTLAVTARANFCRVKLKVTTSSSSHVITEAWLPTNWKNKGKRLVMNGNSGWGGCILFEELAWTSGLGFAAIGHDTGHVGPVATAFSNPEVWKDWVYRSVLVATKAGKAATNHFYNTPLNKSYFIGCSTGGRQALKLAQDSPDEYDGILAAAPAAYWPNIQVSEAIYAQAVGTEGSPTYLTQAQWEAVDAATMAQCDGIDGVVDGILENPARCDFHPELMLCGPGQTWLLNGCLTVAQVQTVKKLYAPIYGNHGRYIYPGIVPGAIPSQGMFLKYGPFVGSGPKDFLRYVVFNDTSYDLVSQFNLDTADLVLDNDWSGAHSNKSDLSGLQASGNKLLMYHGLADVAIPPEASYRYYNSVSLNMTLPPSGLDSFFRFFPISSLGHCARGKGASYVGGPSQVQLYPGAADNVPAGNSALMSLVKWVEQNEAPETLRGYKLGPLGETLGQKDHCKYPLNMTYKGSGNPNNRASWKCV
ncbi:Tannase and feruloyl esterase [Orbilia oligospora]|uniref:Carboxylic ester hydrolase n=1 Tax=Orbilia oligospora TaxID=2813651 RepID=A0A7C8KBB2_ORBOL|nr:Tannase and feruloyl esterase [Orbilia oligospora]TGJ64088.1 Tannase and feruloyl esterase [Orbilia oligospora]